MKELPTHGHPVSPPEPAATLTAHNASPTARVLKIVIACLCLSGGPTGWAAEIRKADNVFPLEDNSSWVNGFAPTNTDVAVWDNIVMTTGSTLGADVAWAGIMILDPTSPVDIAGNYNVLTLGTNGIDMSGAAQNLAMDFNVILNPVAAQIWNVGPGRTLTVRGTNGPGTGAVTKAGAGVLELDYATHDASHLANTATLTLAGGRVTLSGGTHSEVVGAAVVAPGGSSIARSNAGTAQLVLNGLSRNVGGTVDFAEPGLARTSNGNDASTNGGILGGWAVVNGQDWAQVAAGGGVQDIDAYPSSSYSTNFDAVENVSLAASVTLSNTASLAINSLRFEADATLTLAGTTNVYSLTNLSGGILMAPGAMNAAIVSLSPARPLRGPPGGDLIFHVPILGQFLTNQILIVDNNISGLTKSGNGTLILAQGPNNTYNGRTVINAGTLQTVNASNRRFVSTNLLINSGGTYLHGIANSNLYGVSIVLNGGTLNLNGSSDACNTLVLSNHPTVTGFAFTKSLTVTNTSAPVKAESGTIDVALRARGGLTKTTGRTLLFTQSSSISNFMRIEEGVLQISSNALVNADWLVIGSPTNKARLVLGSTNDTSGGPGSLTVTNLSIDTFPTLSSVVGGGTDSSSALVLDFAHDTNFDLTVLGGPGSYENNVGLMKTGAGMLTLTNSTTAIGVIGNAVGTLKVGNASAISNRTVSVLSGLLDVNGFSLACSLYGSGTVSSSVGGGVTLTLSGVFDGVIANGSDTMTVVASSLQLGGTNTYTGGTTVGISSSLALGSNGTIGSGALHLTGGSLNIAADRTAPIPNVVNMSANTLIYSTGIEEDIRGEFSSSSVNATAGTLTLRNDSSTLSSIFSARFSGAFNFNRPVLLFAGRAQLGFFNTLGTTQTFTGPIEGSGYVLRSANVGTNAGVTILTGTNTYQGPTSVHAGTLLVNGSILNVYPCTVISNGTIGGNGVITMPTTIYAGGTVSPGTSIGRLTLSNSLTFLGGSTCFMELNKTGPTNDVIRGLSTVTYGGTLRLTNVAGTLAAGDSFKLFSATNYSGAFTNIIPPVPGPGLLWKTSSLGSNGTLIVADALKFNSFVLSGTNLVIVGTGGTSNGAYYVLISSNVTLPLTTWTRLSTNTFDGGGNFSFTNFVNLALPQRFFSVQTP